MSILIGVPYFFFVSRSCNVGQCTFHKFHNLHGLVKLGPAAVFASFRPSHALHEELVYLQFLLGKSLVFKRINHCIISLKGDCNQSDHRGKSSNPRKDSSCQQFAHDCTTNSLWVVASDCQHNFWYNKRCVHHISYSQVH